MKNMMHAGLLLHTTNTSLTIKYIVTRSINSIMHIMRNTTSTDALLMTLGVILLSLQISWYDIVLWWATMSFVCLHTQHLWTFAFGISLSSAAFAVPGTTVFGAVILVSTAAKYLPGTHFHD